MRTNKLIIASFSVFMLMACNRDGCTDQSAINYDSKAKNDDGSCVFDDTPAVVQLDQAARHYQLN